MRRIRIGYPISATPLIGDLDGDGRTEIAVGALGMGLWRLDDGGAPRRVAGWPQRGRGPFASSPSCADVDGDGRPELVAGSDDDHLHAWRLDGSRLPGFPYATGGDVYSSPVLADLKRDGSCSIVFGSDDGCVHAIDGRGRPLPGWPVRTGGFVAASPAVADLDGDGSPEVIVGSWDRMLYVIRADGAIWSAANGHPGWPARLGSILWSSPLVADLDGDGIKEIAVAAESLHLLGLDGKDRPGWPQWIGGFTPSSPTAVDLDGDGRLSLIAGGDGLHVFDSAGRARKGFPQDLGGHVWASPLARDLDQDGRAEIYVGSWSGRFHGVRGDGSCLPGFPIPTGGPIFGAAAAHVSTLVFGSWDGSLRVVKPPLRRRSGTASQAREVRHGVPGNPLPPAEQIRPTVSPDPPRAFRATYVRLDGVPPESVRSALLIYRRPDGGEHPSPFLASGGALVAMIEPLPGGATVSWHAVLEGWNGRQERVPKSGDLDLRVASDPVGRIARALRRRVRGR